MKFEFATAARIIFGRGVLHEAGGLAQGLGNRALVITGRSDRHGSTLIALLEEHRIGCSRFAVSGEPTTEVIRKATASARDMGCNLIIGIGGGSAIDVVNAVTSWESPQVSSGSTSAILANMRGFLRLTLTLCSGDAITALCVTSAPVPAVVGMATNGRDDSVSG